MKRWKCFVFHVTKRYQYIQHIQYIVKLTTREILLWTKKEKKEIMNKFDVNYFVFLYMRCVIL